MPSEFTILHEQTLNFGVNSGALIVDPVNMPSADPPADRRSNKCHEAAKEHSPHCRCGIATRLIGRIFDLRFVFLNLRRQTLYYRVGFGRLKARVRNQTRFCIVRLAV
jgi:hypothetical protein